MSTITGTTHTVHVSLRNSEKSSTDGFYHFTSHMYMCKAHVKNEQKIV